MTQSGPGPDDTSAQSGGGLSGVAATYPDKVNPMTEQNSAVPSLDDFEAADTAILSVLHPVTRVPTGWKITLAGPAHPATVDLIERRTLADAARERAKEQARTNGKKWKAEEVDIDGDRKRMVEDVAARIVDWSPTTFRGAPFPYSPANAVTLLGDRKMIAVFNQVIEFLSDLDGFIKPSATA